MCLESDTMARVNSAPQRSWADPAFLRSVATIGSADGHLLLVKGDIAGVIVPDSVK
jgi:hypothetical protein